jgi:hypothetical protein
MDFADCASVGPNMVIDSRIRSILKPDESVNRLRYLFFKIKTWKKGLVQYRSQFILGLAQKPSLAWGVSRVEDRIEPEDRGS